MILDINHDNEADDDHNITNDCDNHHHQNLISLSNPNYASQYLKVILSAVITKSMLLYSKSIFHCTNLLVYFVKRCMHRMKHQKCKC